MESIMNDGKSSTLLMNKNNLKKNKNVHDIQKEFNTLSREMFRKIRRNGAHDTTPKSVMAKAQLGKFVKLHIQEDFVDFSGTQNINIVQNIPVMTKKSLLAFMKEKKHCRPERFLFPSGGKN